MQKPVPDILPNLRVIGLLQDVLVAAYIRRILHQGDWSSEALGQGNSLFEQAYMDMTHYQNNVEDKIKLLTQLSTLPAIKTISCAEL